MSTVPPNRYARQVLLPQIGPEGQERLRASRVALVGCGALGTVIADGLARAGVGYLRIIDRDVVELHNLQRQVLFDEADVAAALPKAVAAARKLARINSEVQVELVVADLAPRNAERLLDGVDLVVDGTDNFEARYLVNDVCVKHRRPWVYGAVVATYGMTTTFLPGRTVCFRCMLAKKPAPGTTPTCDTVGVLGAAVNVVASLEVVQALKVLTGQAEPEPPLIFVDVWEGTWERLSLQKGERRCPACDEGRFDFLTAREVDRVAELCGENAFQITPRGDGHIPLERLADRLERVGEVFRNEYLLRARVAPYELTVFADGRVLVKGAADEAEARGVYAKYVGA
ncbi:MAG: ThiF family adenylyltransferase [Thermoflexales bacterium]|nr:ThiF family adenylyltransferase [Thermoflexales bacterium]